MTSTTHHARYWCRILTAAVLFLLFGLHCSAQASTSPPIPSVSPSPSPGEDTWEIEQRKEMQKKSNLERQQQLKKDTEKLLELATELKQYVDKSNENTLSLDVIRKADQIEKLAKSVKDKMKGP